MELPKPHADLMKISYLDRRNYIIKSNIANAVNKFRQALEQDWALHGLQHAQDMYDQAIGEIVSYCPTKNAIDPKDGISSEVKGIVSIGKAAGYSHEKIIDTIEGGPNPDMLPEVKLLLD